MNPFPNTALPSTPLPDQALLPLSERMHATLCGMLLSNSGRLSSAAGGVLQSSSSNTGNGTASINCLSNVQDASAKTLIPAVQTKQEADKAPAFVRVVLCLQCKHSTISLSIMNTVICLIFACGLCQ